MKKLALSLFGLCSLIAVGISSADYISAQTTPQYQEQSQPAPCPNDTCYNLPCNQAPCTPVCNTDTVCAPAPCAPAPCAPGC